MGPLRFRKAELKVSFTIPLQLKGNLDERPLKYKCLAKVIFTNLKGPLSELLMV